MSTIVVAGIQEAGDAADRRRAFAPALGLAALGGSVGLAHEPAWARRPIDPQGASVPTRGTTTIRPSIRGRPGSWLPPGEVRRPTR